MKKEKLDSIQRPAAEHQYAEELKRLAAIDGNAPRSGSWKLTPPSVLRFVPGDEEHGIKPNLVQLSIRGEIMGIRSESDVSFHL